MPEQSVDRGSPTAGAEAATAPKVRWDDANLKSSYANVCTVTGTREEVVLMFGVNQAWQGGQSEVKVQLTDRIILSPFGAKRLFMLLQRAVAQYEQRFGPLELATQQTQQVGRPEGSA